MMTGTVFRGEAYYVFEHEVTGSEQQGGRPAIIVSNDVGNEHSPVVELVYLTTQEKRPLPTHVEIRSLARPSIALCEQISTVHKSRLGDYAGQASTQEMENIDKAIAVSLGLGMPQKSGKFLKQWAAAMDGAPIIPQEDEPKPHTPPRTVHHIKILESFADAIADGSKTFEVRENKRGYQRGDHVVFEVVTDTGISVEHPLNGKEYAITYVLNGWGLENGYVVFGIREAAA